MISNKSSWTSHMNITLIFSDVPSVQSDQLEYFYRLKSVLRAILNISTLWQIEVSAIDTSIRRSSELNNNVLVSIEFFSDFSGPEDSEALKSKLDGRILVDKLNIMGFKASTLSYQSVNNIHLSSVPSALVIVLCSVFGFVTSLIMLLCLCRFFAKVKYRADSQNSDSDDKKHVPEKELSRSESKSELYQMDQYMSTHPQEFNDILQLISRLQISTSWLVDAYLRQAVEARIEASQEISTYDRAAALQLLCSIDLEDDLAGQSSERKKLLEQRINEGPFTKIHSIILKKICKTQVYDISLKKKLEIDSDGTGDECCWARAIHGTSELTDGSFAAVTCQVALNDVLFLLKTCELEPSYLMLGECRMLIEEILTTRKGPLQAVHFAVLQLLSKAEINSDLSIDSMRRHLLEKRIKEGPLNADHLHAVQSLCSLEKEDFVSCCATRSGLNLLDAGTQNGSHLMSPADLDHACTQQEYSDICPSNLVFLSSSNDHAIGSRAVWFTNKFHGVQIEPAVFSQQEKSAFRLIKMRAKTADFGRSLPELVENCLMPADSNPLPLATVLSERLCIRTHGEAVEISCEVRADLGFLMPAKQPNVQTEASSPMSVLEFQAAGLIKRASAFGTALL